MSVSIAIIGARTFTDYKLLCTEVLAQCLVWDIDLFSSTKTPVCVVSGHCKGADLLGEKFARQYNLKILVLKPDWAKHGKRAGFLRNHDIIAAATHVIAFPSSSGSGTQHSIKLARSAGKPCHVVMFD